MAYENTSEITEIKDCSDTMFEEGSLVSKAQEECVSEIKEVSKPQGLNLRRHSTGLIGSRVIKPEVKSRYRGDHPVSSTHDFCKYGGHVKRCDQDDVVKPWRRMSVEGSKAIKVETLGSEALKVETLGSRKKPPRNVSGLIQPVTKLAAKRDDALALKKKPSLPSVSSESVDESSGEKTRKKKETESSASDSSTIVKRVSALKKVSRSSKVSALKNLKSTEKAKFEMIEDEEKTVCVVESSVQNVQLVSEKKSLSGDKSLKTTKKENGSTDIESNPKPEKKVRPKRIGVKSNLTKQLTFKKGKILEPKLDDSSPKRIRFRQRALQEQKTKTEGMKKNLKPLDLEMKTDSSEDVQREKVVLKHREGEKKKTMTLLNNVIEETMKKFTKVKKHKVDAIIGAFEAVISLQETKTSQKVQSKITTTTSSTS